MSFVNKHIGFNSSSGLNDTCGMHQYHKQVRRPNEKPLYRNKKMVRNMLNELHDEPEPESPKDKPIKVKHEEECGSRPVPTSLVLGITPEGEGDGLDVMTSGISVEAQKLNNMVGREI